MLSLGDPRRFHYGDDSGVAATPEAAREIERRARLRMEVELATNNYRSSEKAAEGFSSGKLVYNLRHAKKRLEKALWEARDVIYDLVRD